jgi:hypothetical protein
MDNFSLKTLVINDFKTISAAYLSDLSLINIIVGKGYKEDILTAINLLHCPLSPASWGKLLLSDGEYRENQLKLSSPLEDEEIWEYQGKKDLKYLKSLFGNSNDRFIIETTCSDEALIKLDISYSYYRNLQFYINYQVVYLKEELLGKQLRTLELINNSIRKIDTHIDAGCYFLPVSKVTRLSPEYYNDDLEIKTFLFKCLNILDDAIVDIFVDQKLKDLVYIRRKTDNIGNYNTIPIWLLDNKTENFINLIYQLSNITSSIVTINLIEDYLPFSLISLFYQWLSQIAIENNIQLFITTDNLDIISIFTSDAKVAVHSVREGTIKLHPPELSHRIIHGRGLDIR